MSTLSEHTGNGNPPATRLQREDTKAQLDGVLQHFDVLPSRFDQFLFKYIYVFLIGLFVPLESYNIFTLLSMNTQIGGVLLQGVGLNVPPIVVTILVIWRFNAWRVRTPHTLRDLWEHKRISIPGGDTGTSYLRFLEQYRDALASPNRYFLCGFLMIVISIPFAYFIVLNLAMGGPTIFVTAGVVVNLLYMCLFLGAFYCNGILTWAMFVSGWYIRKLVRAFQLSIQPFHPDECGGLRLLGNFCFGLASPPLIGSGLLIGYSIFALFEYSPAIYPNSVAYLVLFVYFPLLSALLFGLPEIVFNFILPLQDIHRKMVSAGRTNEHRYFTRTEALREEIQALLAVNLVEAARAVQEKRHLVETLYAPYPTWPFHVRSKISKTVLEVSGSLLLGLITAAIVQYSLPAIIILFFHIP